MTNFLFKSMPWIWIWAFPLLISTFLVFGSSFKWFDSPDFISLVDLDWFQMKQKAERNGPGRSWIPSRKVQLLQAFYDSRVQFWSDETAKNKALEIISAHKGPVILNLPPVLLETDEKFKEILKQENLVRVFSVAHPKDMIPTRNSVQIENKLSNFVDQSNLSKLNPDLEITPQMSSYFDGGLPGFLTVNQEETSQFVFDYALTKRGGVRFLPSALLSALSLYQGCSDYFYSNPELHLKNCRGYSGEKLLKLADPLPIFFYHSLFKNLDLSSPQLNVDKDSILIFEVVDPSSYFATMQRKKSFGELFQTLLSNVLDSRTPKEIPSATFPILYSLLVLFICVISQKTKFKDGFGYVVLALATVFALDFAATYFLNLRTYPIPIFLSLSLTSMVSLARKSIIEFQERSLMERALTGYVSPTRLEGLLSGKAKLSLEGEKRVLSILLLDIAGFSKLTKDLKPENVFSLMRDFFQKVDPLIFEFNGTIDKKTGDGLLAFFGDHEGESESAAALAAVKAASKIQALLRAERFAGQMIESRIGINTAEVFLGNSGSEKHFNYTVLGEGVNFTQRLEAACPSGDLLVGEKTADLIKDQIKSEKREISIKNQEGKFPAFYIKLS